MTAQFTDPLTAQTDFNMLSLKDLIEARDLYHIHLMHKQNVVATALGRYLIRTDEPWPHLPDPEGTKLAKKASEKPKPKRTLDNSEVRPYSWPCILVLVDQWVDEGEFRAHGAAHPEDLVPKALYLSDGRIVPVCVVEAPRDESADPVPAANLNFPSNLIGGGYPLLADVQGEEHVASIGCLVTDGHLIYALTNRHVAGPAGEPVYSMLGGHKVEIGKSSEKQLTRLPFEDVYSGWPGKKVLVNLDIGLVELADKNRWTAQVYGVGMMGNVADLSIDNLSLRLIGSRVRAFGSVSREMYGQIHGLFYRYKSVGGFEYVADFLIGARSKPLKNKENFKKDNKKTAEPANVDNSKPFGSHPGDSGAVWFLEKRKPSAPAPAATAGRKKTAPKAEGNDDEKFDFLPLAVQWGGHVFVADAAKSQPRFALATCLSTICNLLEVDVIRDWNIGQEEYWGAVGHYTIANKACGLVKNKNLKKLMSANLQRISFDVEDITKKSLQGLSNQEFVPLADVPDLVWKRGKYNRGQPEHPNHFADMDKPNSEGQTLLDICKGQPQNVAVDVWLKYYNDPAVNDQSKGLLPFRCWQLFQGMVDYVEKQNLAGFVCAAGVLSHYVGDACQPLHISYMFDGDPDDTVEGTVRDRRTGAKTQQQVPRAAGVHSAYEDTMVDYHVAEIDQGIDSANKGAALPAVKTGHDAAVAVVALMQQTFNDISPRDIVNAFNAMHGQKPKAVADGLWEQFGDETIAVMTEGSRYLAWLWDCAWEQGGGDGRFKMNDLEAVDEADLAALYQDHGFMPSHTLETIGPLLH